jgi:hypothetical protein
MQVSKSTGWIAVWTLAAALLLGGSLVSRAQLGGDTPCRHECREDKAVCVETCSNHSNPVECEATCRDEMEHCLMVCD